MNEYLNMSTANKIRNDDDPHSLRYQLKQLRYQLENNLKKFRLERDSNP